MRHLISVLVLATGCTASVKDNAGGGGDDENSESARFEPTAIRDERFDQIDFTLGAPMHTHAGPEIELGGADCPDVYKYSYLMEKPRFGGEVTPNPLAFAVTADEFRIRRNDEVVADWAPVDGNAIAISRATIGDREGTYFVDLRSGNAKASACWNHHPLAAPLDVQPAQLDASGLVNMKLLMDSPISMLLDPTKSVRVYTQHFFNHTAEPVTVKIDVTPAVATYTRRAVEDYVVTSQGIENTVCEDADGNLNPDPICTMADLILPQVLTGSGALASAKWVMTILDVTTGDMASNCTITDLHATCQLPPRTTDAPPTYRIVLSLRNAAELAPSTVGPFAEHTLMGLTYTGTLLEVTRGCKQMTTVTKFGRTITSCTMYVEHTHIEALDSAKIMFPALPIKINGASYDTAPYVWDAGDDDLPGRE